MKDGFLGIAPHATSPKSFVFKGVLPGTLLTGIKTQNVWTWVITAVIFLAWGLLLSLWMHPYFINYLKIEEGWAVTIESTLTIGLGLLFSLFVVPELNKAFEGAPDITAIDPSQISGTLQASSGAAVLLLGTVAHRKLFGQKEE